MSIAIGVVKLLAYALTVSCVYLVLNGFIGISNQKATGFSVLRAQGYPIMLIGVFTVVLGFVITRLDLISVGGRPRGCERHAVPFSTPHLGTQPTRRWS